MIEIIPAIDIIEGKCVRLEQGNYSLKKVYNQNPLEVAKQFEDAGIRRLHLVDLDGAKSAHVVNLGVLLTISSKTGLCIDFGGGIKDDEDIRKVFEHGADMATIGSIAIKEPCKFDTWIEKYGSDKIILGADVKEEKIAISGWLDVTDIDLFDYILEKKQSGIEKFLCTDISKDGMLQGPAFNLYKNIVQRFPDIYLIASGGVTTVDDIYKLREMKVPAVIIGKAIYENTISFKDLSLFNNKI